MRDIRRSTAGLGPYKWAIKQELLCIGYTSDDYTHEEYLAILRSTEKAKGRT